jgi:hypothetical protein
MQNLKVQGLLWKSWGERLQAPKGVGTPQEDQQSQLTWILGNSQRLNTPTREHTQAGPRSPHTYVTDVQPGLYVGPEQLELELSQTLLPVRGICSSWATLSGLRGRGCTRAEEYIGGPRPPRGERKEKIGEGATRSGAVSRILSE